jgi:hypothetical protein
MYVDDSTDVERGDALAEKILDAEALNLRESGVRCRAWRAAEVDRANADIMEGGNNDNSSTLLHIISSSCVQSTDTEKKGWVWEGWGVGIGMMEEFAKTDRRFFLEPPPF